MSDDLPMDDNLHGLLVELAEHPEELALGARVRRFQDLLRPDAIVLRPGTGMGAIEAKLLEAHRDELAHLLLEASQVQVSDAVLLRPRDRKGRARPVDEVRWRREASACIQSRLAEAQPAGPLSLLTRVLASESADPTPRELAIASLRLVPRTSTTIWVGVHYGLEGDRERGIELQKSVLDDSINEFYGAYAWNNVAWLSGELGRFHDALEAGRQAAISAPGMTRGTIAWLLSAIQAGAKDEATWAATALRDTQVEEPEALQEYTDGLQRSRELGLWSPTTAARYLTGRLCDLLPTEAELLLEVFG